MRKVQRVMEEVNESLDDDGTDVVVQPMVLKEQEKRDDSRSALDSVQNSVEDALLKKNITPIRLNVVEDRQSQGVTDSSRCIASFIRLLI
jgi:hypothetical protein